LTTKGRGEYSAESSAHGQHDSPCTSKQRVGVTSSGDTYDLVHDRLTDLINAKCDVCVCACRTSGGTHTAIYNFTGYISHFEQKTYAATPTQEPIVNAADANKLFSLI
jgi:phage tail sheath gpL-like